MSVSGFKIYDASAGSGKTYQLTKNYLKLILEPKSKQKYRQLLALTFTNKAVGEMKQRILESLYHFSLPNTPKSSLSLFKALQEEFSYSEAELKNVSKKTLKELLHNYAFFEVSTIDKFNHKIIRTFARDLKLAQNFEVALDTESLLHQAVIKVLNKAGSDQKLTKTLLNFAVEKIEDNKSWNIAYDLNQIGKILFNENHSLHLKNIESKTIDDFGNLKSILRAKVLSLENNIIKNAEQVLTGMETMGFEPTDFPRETLPNHFKKMITGEFDPKKLYANKLEENLQNDKILKTTISKSSTDLSSFILNYYCQIKDAVLKRQFYKITYKNILPLTLINEIAKALASIQKEQNVLNISEFNTIISNEIKDQPVPFIYERLGEKYRHYFIDEFQDTSQKQWQNLVPLIANALESENEKGEKGSLLLVGDVKQSIYRWRGGEPEQFLNLALQKTNPFVLSPTITQLAKNWRSYSEIVDFNNDFFSFVSSRLGNTDFQQLYIEGNKQLKNTKTGGYVALTFLPEDKETDTHPHCEQTLHTVNEIIKKGYAYDTICVVVRSNKHGVAVADFLAQQGVPIVSSEALLLKNNTEVQFLIALLQLIAEPNQKENSFKVLEYLAPNASIDHDFIFKNIHAIKVFLLEQYQFDLQQVQFLSTYDILELAILKFDLAKESNAYLNYLLDEVFDFNRKHSVALFDFLDHWERKKEKLAIVAPEEINAVKIMTIHKTKGLEFPFVIFPFADGKIDDKAKSSDVWVPVEQDDFSGFKELMVKASSNIQAYSKSSEEIYLKETENAELDDYNVLYVALTRAIQGLFIISTTIKTEKSFSYGTLFKTYLQHLNYWDETKTTFSFGEITAAKNILKPVNNEFIIPYIYTSKAGTDFNLVKTASSFWDNEKQAAIATGNLLHKAFSKIYSEEDIGPTIRALTKTGELTIESAKTYHDLISKVVNHSSLKKYYSKDVIVYNELEITTPENQSLRPDRIVILQDRAVIIDYKTGKKSEAHKNQLDHYAAILSKMGYFVSAKIVVYIDQSVTPIFV